MAYSAGSESENSISEIDSDTDNDTVSYTASTPYTPAVRPQTTVLESRVSKDIKDTNDTEDCDSDGDSEESDDVCDGRILRAYLKMLHDHLVKTVMMAL